MNKEYLELLQKQMGSTAVGPSTARGMGPAGTIQAARQYLQQLSIPRFVKQEESDFHSELNAATRELQQALPEGARNWGSARKFLNIFLRNCAYNRYICKQYQLEKIECWLEVPIDSHVVNGLREEGEPENLPILRTVIGLTCDDHNTYQQFASQVAKRDGVLRVHLDVKYWRRNA